MTAEKSGNLAKRAPLRECAWWWYPETGFLRPGCAALTEIFCLDALPLRAEEDWSPVPLLAVCDPARPSQVTAAAAVANQNIKEKKIEK